MQFIYFGQLHSFRFGEHGKSPLEKRGLTPSGSFLKAGSAAAGLRRKALQQLQSVNVPSDGGRGERPAEHPVRDALHILLRHGLDLANHILRIDGMAALRPMALMRAELLSSPST